MCKSSIVLTQLKIAKGILKQITSSDSVSQAYVTAALVTIVKAEEVIREQNTAGA